MTIPAAQRSVDAFLGGRLRAVQPVAGHHRSGLEAVLLAAALPPELAGDVVDLGGGVGVAGLCAAVRCPAVRAIIVERDGDLLDCAAAALALPANQALAGRVRLVRVDIAAPERERIAAGLARGAAAAVITNPPFHEAGGVRQSPAAGRAAAHVLDFPLGDWFRVAASGLMAGGTLVAVLPAAALAAGLAALSGRFGGVAVLPVHPREGRAASRILLRAAKGSRAPLALLPGLVLHGPTGNAFLPPVAALLAGEAGLGDIHPAWLPAAGSPS